MSYQSENSSTEHRQKIETLQNAKLAVRKNLIECRQREVDPDTVRIERSSAPSAHTKLHLAVLDYVDELRPFREKVWGSYWTPALPVGNDDKLEIKVPVPSETETPAEHASPSAAAAATLAREKKKKQNAVQGEQARTLTTTTEQLSLGGVDEWADRYVEFEIYQRRQHEGLVKESRQQRLVLPLKAATAIYHAANDIRQVLGFTARLEPGNAQSPDY